MTRTRNVFLCIALAALLVPGLVALGACSSTRPVSEQIDDAAITAKIKSKLAADPQINPFNIDVDTREGIVTLSGEVKHAVARSEAEKLARDTAGVRRVINNITVAG